MVIGYAWLMTYELWIFCLSLINNLLNKYKLDNIKIIRMYNYNCLKM